MKVNELTKKLSEKFGTEITNKEVITFLKEHDFKISSHMQNVDDNMLDIVNTEFNPNKVEPVINIQDNDTTDFTKETIDESLLNKQYSNDDMIVCKSVVPYKLCAVGVDGTTVYNWEYFGDIDYLRYRDLQALRRSDYITKPLIIIEDPILCYKWRRELGDIYKYYTGVEYPEEFFEKSDEEFKQLLNRCPDTLKEVIKITAIGMIKNKNYPTVQKLEIIDLVLGSCLKDIL